MFVCLPAVAKSSHGLAVSLLCGSQYPIISGDNENWDDETS